MHEVGIIESTLDLVGQHAARERATRVERIVLRVGALSGVDVEALRFAFEAVSPRTIAAGAVLDIIEVAAAVHCGSCDRDFSATGTFVFTCPTCGGLCGDVRAGRELELSRIEMS